MSKNIKCSVNCEDDNLMTIFAFVPVEGGEGIQER